MMILKKELCIGCGLCTQVCLFGAVELSEGIPVFSDKCTHCGMCVSQCPVSALYSEEEKISNADKSMYKGIWVVNAEEGRIGKSVLELLSKASELAKKRQTSVILVSLTEVSESDEIRITGTGCHDLILFNERGSIDDIDKKTGAIVQAIRKKKPEIVLFGATANGRDLAPKVACRLKTGLTADCTGLDIDENGDLLQIRPTYGGSIMATIRTPDHRPQMATVRPGVFDITESQDDIKIIKEIFPVEDEACFGRIKHISRRDNNEAFASVDEAEIIIAGGYGLGSKENFHMLYQLADKLGAAVAATRKAVDEGWAPAIIQVGQTGKTVRPAVYIAFGVSGALQHTLGMKKAKKIIAVNNDPAAPIFGICDKAILGDAAEIVKNMLKNL